MSYSIVNYLNVSYSGLITSVWEERAIFQLSITCNYVVSVKGGSSSSWCLGKAELIYCGTPCA